MALFTVDTSSSFPAFFKVVRRSSQAKGSSDFCRRPKFLFILDHEPVFGPVESLHIFFLGVSDRRLFNFGLLLRKGFDLDLQIRLLRASSSAYF